MTDPVPLPVGVRDVLPVEAMELGALRSALGATFSAFGYREVMTPLIEFADVLARAEEEGVGRAYRLFDDDGRVLVLRPDLTIPIARLIATRMADHPGPVRVTYTARVIRPPAHGTAESAEQRQTGIELVGDGGPGDDAEVIAALSAGLAATGLADVRIAIGSVALVEAILSAAEVTEDDRVALWGALRGRSIVDWRNVCASLDVGGDIGLLLEALPVLRGGTEVLDRIAAAAPDTASETDRIRRTLALIEAQGVAPPMIDLGVVRDWSYYSGIVIEAYAGGVAVPVAVGGRYDGLAARFGRSRPAVGVAVILDLLHHAVGRYRPTPPVGVVVVGGDDDAVDAAASLRRTGVCVVAVPAGHPDPEGLARMDDRRFVARHVDGAWNVDDLILGSRTRVVVLEEGPWN